MLCPRCGKAVGDRPDLCDSCAAEAQKAADEVASNGTSTKQKGSELRRPKSVVGIPGERLQLEEQAEVSFGKWFWSQAAVKYVAMSIACFVIAFLVHIALSKNHDPLEALLSSTILLIAIIILASWAKMWMELFLDHPSVAFLSFLFPMMLPLAAIFTHPERTWKPFVVHCSAISVGTALLFFVEEWDGLKTHPLWKHVANVTGF